MILHALRGAALLAAFVLFAPVAFAQTTPAATTSQQPGPGTGRMADRRAEMMKELNLTADQQAKVEALMQENRAAMQNRPSGPPTEADRQAMQARRATMEAKMKEILTPEQYTKYQAMRPQRSQPGRPAN